MPSQTPRRRSAARPRPQPWSTSPPHPAGWRNAQHQCTVLVVGIAAMLAYLRSSPSWNSNFLSEHEADLNLFPPPHGADAGDPRLPSSWSNLPEIWDNSSSESTHADLIQRVVAHSSAVVLKGTAISSRVRQWSVEYFAERCSTGTLPEVKVMRMNGTFMHYDERNQAMISQGFASAQAGALKRHYALSAHEGAADVWSRLLQRQRRRRQARRKGSESVNLAEDAADDIAEDWQDVQRRIAVTVALELLCGGALVADLEATPSWWQRHFVHMEQTAHPESPSMRTLWIAQPGVTTSWHFDTHVNFFVHLSGRKRVLVLPPAAYASLYLYPSLHPLYRKSQIIWEEHAHHGTHAMEDEFPGWASHTVAANTLEPGDVLFLPPFTLHRVEAVGERPSVSLSLWSTSHDSARGVLLLTHLRAAFEAWAASKAGRSGALDRLQAALHLLVVAALPSLKARRAFFDALINRQYVQSSTPEELDLSACRPCERAASDPPPSPTPSAQDVAAEMARSLAEAPEGVRPIVLSFVLEKALHKLVFDDVRTVVCFIASCLADHLAVT